MKISEIITDKYKLRIPPTVYYDLLADVQEVEEEQEPTIKNCESCRYYGSHHDVCNYCNKCSLWTEGESTTKNDLGVDCISRADALALYCDKCPLYNCTSKCASYRAVEKMPPVTPQLSSELEKNSKKLEKGTTKNDLAVDIKQLKTMIRGLTKWYVKRDNTEVGEPNTAVGLLYDDVMFGIDRLPSVTPQEPRWILVSESLPESDEEYHTFLVTDNKGRVRLSEFYLSISDKKPYWSGMINVIAWMPLPKPYEPQESEVEDGNDD